jgi:hypothetical protein
MEMLLQLMLKWDPVQRGGKTNADSKKPQCFEVLEQILCMKVSSVMYHTVFIELTIDSLSRLASFIWFGLIGKIQ